MNDQSSLAAAFEQHRPHLRAVAYRMLGSASDADDAVQEAWLRLGGADVERIENLGGWLTTVVSRICLNVLRSRRAHGVTSLETYVPDPVVTPEQDTGPEHDAVLGDTVSLALLVVLESLSPAQRLAFVLHDLFGLSFDDVAAITETSSAAARQQASRARRQVRGAAPTATAGRAEQRRIVDAFFAAARAGNLEALIEVLHPDVALRADFGRTAASAIVRGAPAVASRAATFADPSRQVRPVRVNGQVGVVVTTGATVTSIMAFSVLGGRISRIEVLGDPARLARLA